MSDDTPQTAADADAKRIRAQIARALWILDQGDDLPQEAEARKTAYGAARKAYMRKAAKLAARLPRRGVTLSWTGTPEASGGDDA